MALVFYACFGDYRFDPGGLAYDPAKCSGWLPVSLQPYVLADIAIGGIAGRVVDQKSKGANE